MSDANRDRILRRALALFVAHGYDGVGVQQIATSANITKPTLYHYFGNKAGLLAALLAEQLEPFHDTLGVAAVYEGDAGTALAKVAKATFGFARREPDLYRLLLSLWFAPPKSEAYRAARRFHERQYGVVESLFLAIAKDQGTVKDRHRLQAAAFLGMLNNCVSLALNGYTKLNDRLLRLSVHQFVHGIFA
jgi:AcrR family transcriptional regulator